MNTIIGIIMDYSKKILLLIFLLSCLSNGYTQVLNDECIYAEFIADVSDYCSGQKEFTNIGATPSPQVAPGCWPQGTGIHDVWYSFVPKQTAVFIQLAGFNTAGDGTLVQPSMEVYAGTCNALTSVACGSILFNENILEITLTDVNIGQLYYLRIDGRENNTGSFKLCIDSYSAIKQPESDCKDAVVLCNKDPFYVENLAGTGAVANEIEQGSCIESEFASVWYKWTCKDAGSLAFSIRPNNFTEDDIDFAVYELPGGLDDCANKKRIRCMASGETVGASPAQNAPCFEDTGLSLDATDLEELPGCSAGDDNYVAALQMEVGKSYCLIINNFSRSGYGFSIEFGGTGTFLGPESDFEVEAVNAFECDKTIVFTNKSRSLTDSIISYKWNFGYGADQTSSTSFGPHSILYNSFGFKTAALTLESLRGCIVTKTVDFFVNPCCKDTSTLEANAFAIDILCFGDQDGIINGSGIRGAPEYSFSLDSILFRPNPRFGNLRPGEYTLYVRDIKGCIAKVPVTLQEPEEIIVDAGADFSTSIGCPFTLSGSYTPRKSNDIINWTPNVGMIDTTALTINGTAIRTTNYTLTVTDENGCSDSDDALLSVAREVSILAPNIISANGDGDNDIFNLAANKAVDRVEVLRIYDRWGNKVYEGTNLPKGDLTMGWDGTFNNVPVAIGVYVWTASLRLLDDTLEEFHGDVTVIR